MAAEVATTTLQPDERVDAGVELGPVLVRVGLASSLGDARRQVEQGGLSVNGQRIEPGRQLGSDDVLHGRWILLRKGKRGWAALEVEPAG